MRCRLEELPDYVSGQLSPERTRAWDRHLISCVGCQHAVVGERRLRSLLASGCPSMSGSLHAQLVALASTMAAPPVPPAPPHPAPLQMMAPSAPPAHRSPLRSAALATAAAGATAAVAWSLTLVGTGAVTTTVPPTGGPSPSVRPALGTVGTTVKLRVHPAPSSCTSTTSVRGPVLCEAESTP